MIDLRRLSKAQKEGLFSYLMGICIEAQREGCPFATDSPIEMFLSEMEIQAGHDGYIYRPCPQRKSFVLCEMVEQEISFFERIVYGRLL